LWGRLEKELGSAGGAQSHADEQRTRELQRTCLGIDEKFRELDGAIDMSHSRYYADPRIVNAIADFLESGRRPDFSDVGGTDASVASARVEPRPGGAHP
jgi:hypothetical protein